MHLGIFVRRAQYIYDIRYLFFLLTHQLKIIYSKMGQLYINILDVGKSLKQETQKIYK